ncbi:purine nucleoside phosphorylase LACC1 isoform X2 [Spea bombifrons]|nr:purine nucleoside phosphorylase LACC1 isoform X2 [Spea bombifrons]
MSREEAVLIDLFDPGCPLHNQRNEEALNCALNTLEKCYGTNAPFTYLMLHQDSRCVNGTQDISFVATIQHLKVLKNGLQIVRNSSMAAILYSIKQDIDRLNINKILVLLPQQRKKQMGMFLNLLFTEIYKFRIETFEVHYETDYVKHLNGVSQVALEDYEKYTRRSIQEHLESLAPLKGKLEILKSYLIPEDIFLHGYTTRSGGISYIPTLSALNLFSSSRRRDPKMVVAENFRRLGEVAGFSPKNYVPVKVDHANNVWIMGKPQPDCYDGIVTNQRGVVIAAPGADCIPLLFCDPVTKACGAAHSGWKGTLLGVAMATVNAMMSEYGSHVKDILVVLGPSVGPCCFTLSQQEAKAFHAIDPQCVRQLDSPNPYIDIRRATRILLERGGILPEHIQDESVADKNQNLTLCTSCHPDKFFSHVRDGTNFGTQIGFISIKE